MNIILLHINYCKLCTIKILCRGTILEMPADGQGERTSSILLDVL